MTDRETGLDKEDMDGLTRRGFLKASCGVGATALLTGFNTVTMNDLAEAATREPLPKNTGILVVVTLYGGNDGLNTVIPYGDSTYYAQRPDLAYQPSEVIKLDKDLGLNPGMIGLKQLWDRKKVAIIRGVGYPNSDHSHFRSMDIWQTANPTSAVNTGWIGRWLDYGTTSTSLSVLNIGSTMPPLVVGKKRVGSTLPIAGLTPPTGNLAIQLQRMATGNTVTTGTTGRTTAQSESNDLRQQAASSLNDLFVTAGRTATAMKTPVTVPTTEPTSSEVSGATTGGQNQLGAQLDVVARLINANLPTRVYSVSLGGFDTHSAEKGTQALLLSRVSNAVASFMKQIDATTRKNDVTVLVYSEFGRRVAANLTQGTDHGTAGPVFVIGNKVNGGFYGDQPSLRDLYMGDLAVTTDFRDVYATLIEKVLSTDPGVSLGPWKGRIKGLL